MNLRFPTFYIATCLDTQGNTWTFERGDWPSDNTVRTRNVTDASQLTKYSLKDIRELGKLLNRKPAAFWDQALEDYEEGDVPLTLNKSTFKLQRVDAVISAMTPSRLHIL